MNDDELATVYTTTHTADAEIVRLALEEEGLAAFVDGAQQGGFAGVWDVHVRVARPQAERARRVIEQMRRPAVSDEAWQDAWGESEQSEGDENADENESVPNPARSERGCPSCGAEMEPGFANAIGLTGPTRMEPRIVFIVPGSKTSLNPVRALQQGLGDEPQDNAYALRGWRCVKCGRVELVATDPVAWP